jgi:hypothetical protein
MLPSITFLLALFDQQSLVCNELNKKSLLSLGLVSISKAIYVDYPIFIKATSEHSCVFFQMLLKIIKLNIYVKKMI